jgi:hypothetical protein
MINSSRKPKFPEIKLSIAICPQEIPKELTGDRIYVTALRS